MSEPMPDKEFPPVISPEEGGVLPNRQSDAQLPDFSITNSQFRQGPFGERLNALSEDGSNTFGGKIGTQLTVAAYRQLEHQNLELKNELSERNALLDSAREEISELKIRNATAQIQTRQSSRASWVMASIYALASLLIGIGYGDIAQAQGKVLIGLGGICFILGFLSPLLLVPGADR